MPQPLTAEQRAAFLAEPHVAVLSVATNDGRPPLTVPVWYAYDPDADQVLLMTTTSIGRPSRKLRLLLNSPSVAICVQREEPPYKYVSIEGTIVQIDQPAAADQVLPILRRYLPEEAAQGFIARETAPGRAIVRFVIRPDRWDSLDFAEE